MRMEMEWVICLIFMAVCTAMDIRKKEVSTVVIVLSGIFAFLYAVIGKEESWAEILYSLFPGIFLLLLSLCTKESIGYGDGLTAMVSGMLTGWKGCTAAIVTGFLLSAVFSLVLLVCGKVKGKSRIPFLPFFSVGLGVFYIAQKGI